MKAGLVVVAVLLALAGCKGDAKKETGAGKAQGEVLPGAVSDAMLPLDSLKSQPPLAPKVARDTGDGADTASDAAMEPDAAQPQVTATASDPAVAG